MGDRERAAQAARMRQSEAWKLSSANKPGTTTQGGRRRFSHEALSDALTRLVLRPREV